MSFSRSLHRFTYAAALAGLLGMVVSGCGGGGGSIPCILTTVGCTSTSTNGSTSTSLISATPASTRGVCTANPSSGGAHPRWTVLVYMNSANNLEPYSFPNVAQMASVGSDNNVNIVLQWKQIPNTELQNESTFNFQPSFLGTHRYFIKAHNATDVANIAAGNTSSLEDSERLADPSTNVPEVYPPGSGTPVYQPGTATQVMTSDMGNVNTLQNFIQWGTTNYPADNLAVVVWDHGSGWLNVYRPNQYQPTLSRAVSQDDDFLDEIETWEMPEAFGSAYTNGKKIDDLIFDCSLQQMIEVEYQVSTTGNVKVMVGSEESPPAAGYPYDKWLLDLKASGKNPCDLGTSIITEFCNAYSGQTKITQSDVDVSQPTMTAMASALNTFGTSCLAHVSDQATVLADARSAAPLFGQEPGVTLYDGFVDLYNYASVISTTTTASDLKTAATNLMTAISNPTTGPVLQYGRGASDEANSHGMSAYVYIPNDPALGGVANPFSGTNYNLLALATAAPKWTQFLGSQTK